jgi:hypothetical protein
MKIKSEHPTIYCQDESAIILAGVQALNEAIATRVPRITCISSAAPGWYADKFELSKPVSWPRMEEMDYIGSIRPPQDDPGLTPQEAKDPSYIMHGLRYHSTQPGLGDFPFIDLDIEADPKFRNNSDAMRALELKFQPRAWFMREIKRQAYSLSGATIYPEFDPAIHVVPHSMIPKQGTLYMSLDPHPRTPHAALWVLIDPFGDWWVYRELWPSKVYGRKGRISDDDEENRFTIKEYAEAIVQELEGNELEWHNAETDQEYAVINYRTTGEKVANRFMDQAGKGFQAHINELKTEAYSSRYNRYGLTFLDPTKSHAAGEDAIHELLKLRTHDTYGKWPKLHISDRCPELILEMRETRYKQMKKMDPDKELHQRHLTGLLHSVSVEH